MNLRKVQPLIARSLLFVLLLVNSYWALAKIQTNNEGDIVSSKPLVAQDVDSHSAREPVSFADMKVAQIAFENPAPLQTQTSLSTVPTPRAVARNSSGGQSGAVPATETAQALRIVLGLTLLAILPALLVCLTSFLRIIIVLSMLRHAIGMNETPPNTALIGLALFLTLFTMAPVFQQINTNALQPFMAGKVSMEQGYDRGIMPLRDFMVRQTREQDLALMVELSKSPVPKSIADISNVQLVPAFMLSELRSAFQIGFVIFLPFLLIDLIVSSILMALGMMMMPPTTIALPLKILMFILIDGWSLLLKALIGSFH
jgi:flagellar biosynthesis protein FliP